MELMDLVNSRIIFLPQTNLLRWLTFLLVAATVTLLYCDCDYYFLLTLAFCSVRKLWSYCCLNFHWFSFKPKRGSPFHRSGYDFHVLIRTVFVIIWEMFRGTISLNSVLPLLVLNFVRWSRWELMYISLIVSMRLSLIHSYGFQLVVLLS